MIATLAVIGGSVLGAGFLAGVGFAVWDTIIDRRDRDEDAGPDRYRGRHERPRSRRAREAHAQASKARAAVVEARRRALLRQSVQAQRAEAVGEDKPVGPDTIEFRRIVDHNYDTGELDCIRDVWTEAAL